MVIFTGKRSIASSDSSCDPGPGQNENQFELADGKSRLHRVKVANNREAYAHNNRAADRFWARRKNGQETLRFCERTGYGERARVKVSPGCLLRLLQTYANC